MKNYQIALAISLLSTVSAFSQDRTRYFDNFDTARPIQIVHYPPSPKVYATPRNSVAEPAAVKTPGKAATQIQMSVYDGYADRELKQVARTRSVTEAGKHLRGYSTGDGLVDTYIVDSSRRYGIDPLLIYSQMNQESSFKPGATSNKGASGLMQLMPATARRLGVSDIYDPKQNIEGGVKYMRMLLDMFDGDVNLALAGYNAGEGAVMKYGNQIPPYKETQDYVRRISTRYASISYQNVAAKQD